MIKVYLMKTEEFKNEEIFRQGYGLVDSVRLQKIKKCRATEDKVRSLCCGLLVQYAMKIELGVNGKTDNDMPIEFRYGKGQHGKPYLLDYPRLHFNLSHSGEYAVLAVSNQEVGADIQQKRQVKETMAKRILSEKEYRIYRVLADRPANSQGQSDAAAADWFLRCWCAKESFGKLKGQGLLLEPGTVTYEPEWGQMGNKAEGYVFCREYDIEPGYFMNVCCREREDFPEKVTSLTFSHILS